jgi:hypothetical protein
VESIYSCKVDGSEDELAMQIKMGEVLTAAGEPEAF